MKPTKFIFSLLSLIFITALPAGAVKKIEANPINIAVMLTQERDTAEIASTCVYYGYERQLPQDGYTIFTHVNGSKIRYKLIDGDKYPTLEVKSKVSEKEKDKILKNLNFQKNGNAYERKSIGHTTRCASGKNGYLILTKQKPSQV